MFLFLGQITGVITSSHNVEVYINSLLEMNRVQKIVLALQDKEVVDEYQHERI